MSSGSAKAEARRARRQARLVRERTETYRDTMYGQARDMTRDAEQAMSQQMTMLGVTGQISHRGGGTHRGQWDELETLEEGVGLRDARQFDDEKLDSLVSDVAKYKEQIAGLVEQQKEERENRDGGGPTIDKWDLQILELQKKLDDAEDDLRKINEARAVAEEGLEDIRDIDVSANKSRISGSTAYNLRYYHDQMERQRNIFVRDTQNEIYHSIMEARELDDQAEQLEKAASQSGWATLLGVVGGAIIGTVGTIATGGAGLAILAGAGKGMGAGYGIGRSF